MPLGLVEALGAFRVDTAAQDEVLRLAARLMWADPSHDARSAVREAVDAMTVACVGCGTRYADRTWSLTDCDVCGEPVCDSCLARVRRESGRIASEIVVCPRCLVATRTQAGAERMARAMAARDGAEAEGHRYAREVAMLGRRLDRVA